MTAIPLRDTLTAAFEKLLLFSLVFVALPHVNNLHPTVFGFFALLAAWRYATVERPGLRPGKWTLGLLMLCAMALVYVHYHRFYGREGGSALFLVGLGLKLMEMKTRREVYLVIFLGFFVAMTQYLFSQTIPMALYTLVAVGLSVGVLIGAGGGPALAPVEAFKRSSALVAQAVPIMLVLFMFSPRLPGPLWKLPDDERHAKTGLSDNLEPGSISHLGRSAEPAFRVDFQSAPPPNALRYWRGPVFWHTNGIRWDVAVDKPLHRDQEPRFSGPSYRYAITLEPHQRRWLFALELPGGFPSDVAQTADYLLLTKDPVHDRRRFELVSQPDFRTGPLSPLERAQGLQLPGPPDGRVQTLVEAWRGESARPGDLAQRALRYFREEPFFYTLNPPALEDHPIERFLFETRRGFCEHYATSFVYLMRVAGIPARVVTGYQGGAWNPVGRFLEVRQADAHAWAEVWLPERGWTRIDPTAAVAPERIEQGIDLDAASPEGDVMFNPVGEALAGHAQGFRDWVRQGRMLWASVDHAWNQWVLAYDPEQQRRFWDSLGIVDWGKLALWMGGLLGLCGAAAALLFWPRRKLPPDPAVLAYRRFLGKLARRGVVKRMGEGPLDFSRRAMAERPEVSATIGQITGIFLGLRYGKTARAEDLARLRRLVREFRV
ncbi:transglutaminase TgpA family protein [Methylomagnum ishizawai]|uniref:transglutaminase TgpA family protein n=1 Tax=Methylomagnum ishizawai TaxID=1760988 RepID=UPI001C33424B|nr:DUF3488 and transglutaminase-like domain-containing protein [Methylomagnum ishizawai]BBL73125.1 protein-glutamine gamma-glutamyltransferase [Methylomagnum ishizawai]